MPHKQILYAFLTGTVVLVVLLLFVILYLLVYKKKQNAYILERQRLAFEHRNQLCVIKLREQERVMNHLSREIHDNIGQSLSFLKMSLQVISRHTREDTPEGLLDRTDKMLDQVINDTHNISHSLSSTHIKKTGLFDILKTELDYLRSAKSMDCSLHLSGTAKIDDPEKELVIYRIAQEAIQNVIKHAQATQLVVTLEYGHTFRMVILDNGVGMREAETTNGIGLENMRERADFLQGELKILSAPGQGTSVCLEINNR